ncbi:MAG: hypothetical protein P4L10_11020 [Acidobacteriaceae bacterium]|nr:hypothetical protein [Acidobacteriaceae bacterium]
MNYQPRQTTDLDSKRQAFLQAWREYLNAASPRNAADELISTRNAIQAIYDLSVRQ